MLFAHAISAGTDCLVCSTFFRRILIESGEDPDSLRLDDWEQTVVDYGRQLAEDPHGVSDELFARLAARLQPDQIVTLTAFGGLMVATNLFNNALRVDLDDYLHLPQGRTGNEHAAIGWSGRTASSELAGQVAFITGAAHGQGRATALAMAREGVADRRPRRRPAAALSRLRDGLGRRPREPGRRVPRPGRRMPDLRRRRPR